MPDGVSNPKSSIRSVAGLIEAGLVPEQDRDALNDVAARYAIALPAALRALIDFLRVRVDHTERQDWDLDDFRGRHGRHLQL